MEQDVMNKQLSCTTSKLKAFEQSKENEISLNQTLQEMMKEQDLIKKTNEIQHIHNLKLVMMTVIL